mmetsp:Transcript_3015/g.5276  ORF Transcript_3015/g.5276 Transcript_3015/m.5276 type:complete len:301 (-) Transcript_3015:72-974(-)
MPVDRRLYDLLGISPNASQEEVRRAYRRLALKHHPDRGGDARSFQDLSAAYEILGDEERRALYDQVGEEGFRRLQQGESRPDVPAASVFDELLGHFFRRGPNGFTWPGHPATSRMKVRVVVALEDVFLGSTKRLRLRRTQAHRCWEEVVLIHIQPGMDDGSVVACRGDDGRLVDDIACILRVQPHRSFVRKGDDLYVAAQISLADALAGGATRIRHLDRRELRIPGEPPKVVKPGTTRRVEGEGMPQAGSLNRGDLYVKYQVVFPDSLDVASVEELLTVLQPCQASAQPWTASARERSRL